jgi:hypothetical protein
MLLNAFTMLFLRQHNTCLLFEHQKKTENYLNFSLFYMRKVLHAFYLHSKILIHFICNTYPYHISSYIHLRTIYIRAVRVRHSWLSPAHYYHGSFFSQNHVNGHHWNDEYYFLYVKSAENSLKIILYVNVYIFPIREIFCTK